MSAWWLLAGALLMCAAVLTGVMIYENWYHWRDAAHVAGDPVEPGYQPQVYGSLVMLEEAALHHEWLPAPPVDPAPWLEQTRADLAPEALEGESYGTLNGLPVYAPGVRGEWLSAPPPSARCPEGCDCEPCRAGYCSRCVLGDEPLSAPPLSHPVWRNSRLRDPGPGGASSLAVTPGPVPERLCGPEQPHEKPAGTESAGSGHPDRHEWHEGHRPGEALGPRACAVLDRYERRLGARMAAAA